MKFGNNIRNSGLYAGLVKVAQWGWAPNPYDATKGSFTNPTKYPGLHYDMPSPHHATAKDWSNLITTGKNILGDKYKEPESWYQRYAINNLGNEGLKGGIARRGYRAYNWWKGNTGHETITNLMNQKDNNPPVQPTATTGTGTGKRSPEENWNNIKGSVGDTWNQMPDWGKWGVGIGGGLLGGMALYHGLRGVGSMFGGYDDDDDDY